MKTGGELWHGGLFREVVKPERLVFTFKWDEEGERGEENLVTITFAEEGGKTRMTFRQTPFISLDERDGHTDGWSSTFDRLDEALVALKGACPMNFFKKPLVEREITVTRVFAAPRALVFSMFTDAKHLAAWWGPHAWDNPVCEADPRPGGKILIHMRGPDGTAHPMGGVYHEIVPHERIAFTTFVDMPDGNARARGAQHGPLRGERRQDQGDPARARRRLRRFRARTCSPAWRPAGRRASTSSPRMRRAPNGNTDADDQAAIRAMFGDRTNALFGKVADLALKHLADDVVSYDLDAPLQHVGPDKAALQKWFDTWDGPIGWAMGDLTVEVGGDVAFAYGLGHMTGTKTDGDEGRRLDPRHGRLRAPQRRLDDHASAQFGAVPDGRQLQGRGRSQAVAPTTSRKREQQCRKSLRFCGSTRKPKRR